VERAAIWQESPAARRPGRSGPSIAAGGECLINGTCRALWLVTP